MLRIRQEQLEALSKRMYRRFEDHMVADLHDRFREHLVDVTETELRKMISDGVARAKGHGVRAESDVRRFLDYVVEYGPDFGDTPQTEWARAILEEHYLNGAEKMDRIDDYATFVLGSS